MSDYSYLSKEIIYSPETALWLIQNLGSLRLGIWPAEASSYIDLKDIYTQSNQAPFISAVEYAAEITDRLEMCGKDGLILLAMECWGETPESLAAYLKMPVWSVLKRKKKALRYVASGHVRRWHNKEDRPAQFYNEFEKSSQNRAK